MKMVKKVLMGLAVAAVAFALTGCLQDDTEKAIKGSGSKYSIDYTNEGTQNYRAYKSTGLSHAGALVKVTFDKDCDAGVSKMGVIFDLQERKVNKQKLRDFNIIGIAKDGKYYVSRLTNIEDIQDENFGAVVNAATGPSEKELVSIDLGEKVTMSTDSDGNYFVYVWYKANLNGTYSWALLNMTDDQAKTFDKNAGDIPAGAATLASGTIANAFDAVTEASKLPQRKISVYAMIKPGKTLTGKWNIVGKYLEAEDAE